jgi:hypothetical protein
VEVAHEPGGDVPDLAAALEAAVAGDTLMLRPGLYGGIHELKPNVSLVGIAGPDSTVLDADGGRWVLRGMRLGEGVTISGLTLQNGRRDHANSGGGGIYLYESSPEITNCVFRNHLGYLGPGVFATHRSHPVVAFNVFHDNEGYLGGAVAAYVDCSPLVYNNVMYDNTAVSGGGILCLNSAPVIMRNTIVGNSAGEAGGGAVYLDSSPALIDGNVMAWNKGTGAIFCLDTDDPATFRCNLLWQNEGGAGAGECGRVLGVNLNREGNPSFVNREERVLWRRYAGDENRPCYEAAGAMSWNPLDPPQVPGSIVEFWRLRMARPRARSEHPSQTDPSKVLLDK